MLEIPCGLSKEEEMGLRESDCEAISKDSIAVRIIHRAHAVADLSLSVVELARDKTLTVIVPDQPRLEKQPPSTRVEPPEDLYPPLFDELRAALMKTQRSLLEIQNLLLRSEL
jgi:hypothetical protein